MFAPTDYQLLDFGQGRKLERFGACVLDRPCPAAEGVRPSDPAGWRGAQARFDRADDGRACWIESASSCPERWTIARGPLTFELRLADFGQVGVFPEQADNWDWLARQVRAATSPVRLLNLFAYTGGTTLAAAAAGAEVVHVDASRTSVAWARRNASLSGLAEKPVRWIVDDALRFVRREVRRRRHYDAVVLDPPSYGHGPHGESWKLAEHIVPLLESCAQLTAGSPRCLLLSCHTPGFGPAELSAYLSDAFFGHCGQRVEARPLTIASAGGRALPSGAMARWPG